MILLNPGPVNLSERVRRALLNPDLCHRETEFSQLQDEVRARLLEVYGLASEHWCSSVLSGSGTAAVEAMLASLIPRERRVLVIANGVYGERMAAIATAHGIAIDLLRLEWGAEIPLEAVRARLRAHADLSHVAVVHHETTTGRLNDLDALARSCAEHGVELLVDAVSSFGAEALDFASPALGACAATANKCLHGAPGAAFVIARRSALEGAASPPRSVYFDLRSYAREQDVGGTPFTPAIPAFYALREALLEHAAGGGWRARRDRYRELAERVREGLEACGIPCYLPARDCSAALRSYHLPAGLSYEALHAELRKRGFVIYAGQSALRERVFRISTMGEIGDADIDRLLESVEEICRPAGKRGES